jgi:hypothetical protein
MTVISDNSDSAYFIKPVRRIALIVAVLLPISAYYLRLWDSMAAFVAAIDHSDKLFLDFLGYYYPMARTLPSASAPLGGYFCSAFFAFLLAPLGALKPAAAMWIWFAIQSICLVALFALPLIMLMPLRPLGMAFYTGVFATSFPLLHNTKWGQVSVLLTLCMIASFHAYRSNRRVLAGILIAFAAAIKYYPAVLLLYFILKRDMRVCSGALVAVALFYVFIPVALMDPYHWLTFEAATLKSVSEAAWVSRDVNSQYFVHVATRWLHLVTGSRQPLGPACAQLLNWIGYAVFLCSMAVLWMTRRRRELGQCVLSLTMLFLSLPFIIKTSWPHYFSYLPFCQVAVLTHALSYRSANAFWKGPLISLPLLSIACSSVFVFDAFPNWQAYSASGMLFFADLLLLVCVYLLIFVRPSRENDVPLLTPKMKCLCL